MKKNFLPRKKISKVTGTVLLGAVLIIFLWVWRDFSSIRSDTRDILGPFLKFSRLSENFFTGINNFFTSKNKLSKKIDELEIKNILLETKVREFENAANSSEVSRAAGKKVLVSSLAPAVPYGTLLVSFDDNSGITPGMKVIGYGGIYVGEVKEVGDTSATIKLISSPGFRTEAWLERLALNITLEGQGGYNMKFSIPQSVAVEVGDKILSNTVPQFLIGQVETAEEEREIKPLREILLRLPLNFSNLRYVELIR
ncbi:MAG: rod shape-determining protein MreC [bacterium]|nr:rod shape-determining protein MreC [bacterium]